MKKPIVLAALLVASAVSVAAQLQRVEAPKTRPPAPQPVPASLVQAKTIFLINDQPGAAVSDFSAMQTELRRWNRFSIVDAAERADVTLSLSTAEVERVSEIGAPRGARLVNPRTAVVRRNVSTLTIRRRSTDEVLWTGDGDTAVIVVRQLQQLFPVVVPSFCFANWCK
jgi:hypothetical protein